MFELRRLDSLLVYRRLRLTTGKQRAENWLGQQLCKWQKPFIDTNPISAPQCCSTVKRRPLRDKPPRRSDGRCPSETITPTLERNAKRQPQKPPAPVTHHRERQQRRYMSYGLHPLSFDSFIERPHQRQRSRRRSRRSRRSRVLADVRSISTATGERTKQDETKKSGGGGTFTPSSAPCRRNPPNQANPE